MLNLHKGIEIAKFIRFEIDDGRFDKRKMIVGDSIYLSPTIDDSIQKLKTTTDNKLKIFISYLKSKKLRDYEIEDLIKSYHNNDDLKKSKLGRIYDDAKEIVKQSDYKYMSFDDIEVMPVLDMKTSKRIYVVGGSGSGKTTFVTEFINLNRTGKSQPVFYFSPFKGANDVPNIKNLIVVDIAEFESQNERDFSDEDIPDKSICIFDDCDSHRTHKKKLMEIRNCLLETGRHRDISTIVINHRAMQGINTTQCLRECNYYVCFRNNETDMKSLLLKYCNLNESEINNIISTMGRYVFISKVIPKYYVSNNSIKIL